MWKSGKYMSMSMSMSMIKLHEDLSSHPAMSLPA